VLSLDSFMADKLRTYEFAAAIVGEGYCICLNVCFSSEGFSGELFVCSSCPVFGAGQNIETCQNVCQFRRFLDIKPRHASVLNIRICNVYLWPGIVRTYLLFNTSLVWVPLRSVRRNSILPFMAMTDNNPL
jgi:hypothetical protein